jgi:rfaE bifunctional protein kinase chain/domain
MHLMDKKSLIKFIPKFKKKKILVIGDLMIDEYIWGDVTRISPEAPIPVVNVYKEESKPGGAANVILNLMTMDAEVYCAGVVGDDDNAKTLMKYFRKNNINTDAVLVDKKRPTTIKTRVIAHNQQVVRIDKEKKIPLSKKMIDELIFRISKNLDKVDGVIFSDYNKGMITKELVFRIVEMSHTKIISADPKPGNMEVFKDVTILSPQKKEASEATGIVIETSRDVIKAGKQLRKMLDAEAVLITRGEHGMSLFEESGVSHVPTVAKEVYDVTGAGDTVISIVTLALCSGADFKQAAMISNVAAGLSVAEVGVHAPSPVDLRSALNES